MEYDSDEEEVVAVKRFDFPYRHELEEQIKRVLLNQQLISNIFNFFLNNK